LIKTSFPATIPSMENPEKGSGRTYKFPECEFEGPLDLLVSLINENKVSIYDIPIAEITEQYLAYLEGARELDLKEASEFQAMAATLLLIKSRMLLPRESEIEEEEDPRQELVDRLIEYQKFRKLSELMEEKEREAEWLIERKKLQRALPFGDEGLWEKVDVWDLLKTFTSLMTNLSSERIIDLYEEVSINEKMSLLTELLETRREFMFTDLVRRKGSILDIICAFLAILEAVKLRLIQIFQNRMFGDILIRSQDSKV